MRRNIRHKSLRMPMPKQLVIVFSVVSLLGGCGGSDVISPVNSAASITPSSSTNLVALAGAAVPELPAVLVKDKSGRPLLGIVVAFAETSGGGSVSGATQITNSSGIATLGGWTLGTSPGSNTVTASVESLAPITFTATTYPARNGALLITTTTTAVAISDLDPDGYALTLDGSPLQAFGINEIASQSVPAGNHTVILSGVKSNCMVLGGMVRQVSVVLTALASVSFDILCVSPGQRAPMLAYVADNGNSDIYTANIDGTNQVRLTNDPQHDFDPAWSPDGTRIAFVSFRASPGAGLYIMAADGSSVVRCVSGWANRNPAWSPDGRTIAFTGPLGFGSAIYTVNTNDCSASPKPINSEVGDDSHPTWSPEGLQLVFQRNRRSYDPYFSYETPTEGTDLFLMNADGSNARRIIPPPSDVGVGTLYLQPAWSPDGRKIALTTCFLVFTACIPTDIATANLDGSGLKILSGSNAGSAPAWAPDGSTIAFSSGSSIRYVRATGSSNGVIILNGYSPSWRP